MASTRHQTPPNSHNPQSLPPLTVLTAIVSLSLPHYNGVLSPNNPFFPFPSRIRHLPCHQRAIKHLWNTAVYLTPTFNPSENELAWPSDPFTPSNPAPTLLHSDRPHLIAPKYKWDALPSCIANEPYLKLWNAIAYYSLPPIVYHLDGADGILDNACEIKMRIKAFAYVAITRSLKDMRSKGLVQPSATFAGHSLGEFSALASVADILPSSSLVDIMFYHGPTLQHAVEHDEQGRSNYGQCCCFSFCNFEVTESAWALMNAFLFTQALQSGR
jgi:hypothetical protein